MKQNTGYVFLGFLAGAAAGTIAGMLLAPDTGKNTRQNIANKASQLTDGLNTSVQKGVEKLGSFKDSVFSLINGEKEEQGESVNNTNNY